MTIGLDGKNYLKAQLWLVDQYYNDKVETADRYTKKPKTKLIEVGLQLAQFYLNGRWEQDAPTQWNRQSLGLTYDYERSDINLVLGGMVSPAFGVEIAHDQIEKQVQSERLLTTHPAWSAKLSVRNHFFGCFVTLNQ